MVSGVESARESAQLIVIARPCDLSRYAYGQKQMSYIIQYMRKVLVVFFFFFYNFI